MTTFGSPGISIVRIRESLSSVAVLPLPLSAGPSPHVALPAQFIQRIRLYAEQAEAIRTARFQAPVHRTRLVARARVDDCRGVRTGGWVCRRRTGQPDRDSCEHCAGGESVGNRLHRVASPSRCPRPMPMLVFAIALRLSSRLLLFASAVAHADAENRRSGPTSPQRLPAKSTHDACEGNELATVPRTENRANT